MVRPVRPSLAAILLLSAAWSTSSVTIAAAQESAPADPAPQGAASKPKGVTVEKPACIGADPTATIFFAAATKEGHREELGAIAKETAFELWLEGHAPVKSTADVPDPDHPGQTKPSEAWQVPVYAISTAEFQGYCDYIRTIAPIGDESMFVSTALVDLMEQRAVHLYYLDALPKVRARMTAIIDRLELGNPFEKVVKSTEDETGRQANGLFGDDPHGTYIGRYPLEVVLFGMKPGQYVGPIFDKYAAYVFRCEENAQNPADHRRDRVKTRAICVRYAAGGVMSGTEREKLMNSVRLRTDQDRFRRILPPAVQVPPLTKFGPDDIAPIGKPDTPLKQRSLDDARDDKPKGG